MSTGIIGGNITAMGVFQATVDLADTLANTTAVTSVTVPGVRVGDFVFVNKPSHEAGLGIVNVRVSAADTVEITTMNTTAGAINEVSETQIFLWVRPESIEAGIRP